MLIEEDFPRPTPITFAARELIAELKSGPMVLIWYDPEQGPLGHLPNCGPIFQKPVQLPEAAHQSYQYF